MIAKREEIELQNIHLVYELSVLRYFQIDFLSKLQTI